MGSGNIDGVDAIVSHQISAADTTVVTTRIDAALKARAEALARSTRRSKSFLAVEAVAAYVELNERQIGEITAGLAYLDSGITGDYGDTALNRGLQ